MAEKTERITDTILANTYRVRPTTAKPQGVPLSGLRPLLSATANGDATIDFTSQIDDEYDSYLLVGSGVVPANDAEIAQLQVSDDGGSTFETANYVRFLKLGSSGGTENIASATSSSVIVLSETAGAGFLVGSAAGEGISFRVTLSLPSNTSLYKHIGITSEYIGEGGGFISGRGGGSWKGATNAINGLRFKFNTGNVESGEFTLYGLARA